MLAKELAGELIKCQPGYSTSYGNACTASQKTRPSSCRYAGEPLLSCTQYLYDIENWGYLDARLQPPASMTAQDIERWTQKAMHKE